MQALDLVKLAAFASHDADELDLASLPAKACLTANKSK